MCGICGYYILGVNNSKINLRVMTDSIMHRGPDDEGVFEFERVGLGHRRLSIVGLGPEGHQPMKNFDNSLVIVFNGEIYNYVELKIELESLGHIFRSHTDTEVILAAYAQWGDSCVERFNGMWAFAIWDALNNRLFCSRDRFGVKPFYYFLDDNIFIFASEPKAILAIMPRLRKPNLRMAARYLLDGLVVCGDETFYESIRVLRPAHTLSIQNNKLEQRQYWDYPKEDANYFDGVQVESALIELFKEVFLDAVKLRSRLDVEIGTTLSGGLDSSAIVAAFKSLNPGLQHRSYSAVFEGEACDESRFIQDVVDEYRLNSNLVPQSSYGLLEEMKEMVRMLDAPLVSPAIIPLNRVMKKAHLDGIKVLFDGQGADEILAGYDKQFYPAYLHSLLRRFKNPRYIFNLVVALAQVDRRKFLWILRYFIKPMHAIYKKFHGIEAVLLPEFLKKNWPITQEDVRNYEDPLLQKLYEAHSRVILPGLLLYGDGVSMGSSIEYRQPFMDYRLVELSFRLPTEMKISGEYSKKILRDATRGILKDSIRLRTTKNGFTTPIGRWILEDQKIVEATILNKEKIEKIGIFNYQDLLKFYKKFTGQNNLQLEQHVMRWVSYILWHDICINQSE